jgi:hypothetical protein
MRIQIAKMIMRHSCFGAQGNYRQTFHTVGGLLVAAASRRTDASFKKGNVGYNGVVKLRTLFRLPQAGPTEIVASE